jgi:3-hydroxyacyl-CoA dehydrogenase
MTLESIQTVAVIGLGTMGHGIAQAFAQAKFQVRCFDSIASVSHSLHERVEGNLQQMLDAGVIAQEEVQETLDRLVVCESEASTVDNVQFVTEAIAEDLLAKQELFLRLESLTSPSTILASNSSTFPISQSAGELETAQRAILTHWFNPPYIIPVVEVVPGKRTAESTSEITCQLLRKIGKQPVRIHQEIPGFLVNRVQIAMLREVWDLLEQGVASAEDIDEAIRGSMGLRLASLGPLQISDFAGLDICCKVYEQLIPELRSDTQLHSILQERIDRGEYGTKTGRGIYNYTPESIEHQRALRDQRYLTLIQALSPRNRES